MAVVGTMLFRAAASGARSRVRPRARRFGPFVLICVATPLILADVVRHLLNDSGLWPSCGNNPTFSRANSTDPFPPSCHWSSNEYRCEHVCCVPTWLPVPGAANGSAEYAWFPTQPTFFPEGGASSPGGQFATLRGDGSLYLPPGFESGAAHEPYTVFSAPLALFGDGTPMRAPASHPPPCPFGRSDVTGACLLTNASMSWADQVAALPRPDPSKPPHPRHNAPRCACDSCTSKETMSNLSPVGVFFTLVCTYSGFALLAASVLWNAQLGHKLREIREEWRALRARASEGQEV
mmetsp:Transcript_7221/g.21014  ORF Transcript_7221/g.21014 Transcript_7221/m.21014 type:complete len:293 (-) Transcript_7221:512-1390(-)